MAEIVGYARVSTNSQDLEVQLSELTKADCHKVFSEKRSGRHADNRPELMKCLAYVREGDTLVISRLDRMARSVLDLAKIADELRRKGVALKVVNQGIDTSTSEGALLYSILASFAAFEADIRAARMLDGIAMAKKNGVRFGRKHALSEQQISNIRRLKSEEGFSAAQLAERFHVGRATIYRSLLAPA